MHRTPSRNRIIIIHGRPASDQNLAFQALDMQRSASRRIVLFKNGRYVGGRVSGLAHAGGRR
jgi:hypothetical protein